MGRAFINALKAQGALLDDELVNDYLQNLGQRLAINSPEQNREFSFFIINANDINAFAGPNATIGINKGLILAAKNESQLASVIAHEIAHVTQKHLTRAFQANNDTNLVTLATVLAAILVSSSDPTASAALMMGGVAGGMQQQINFTRSNENEADRVGLQILSKSNLNPAGMVEFFEILQSSTFFGSESDIEYLRTHPLNSTRIAEAASRTPKVSWSTPNDSLLFQLARARLAIANSDNPTELQKNFLPEKNEKPAKTYARALLYMRLNKTGLAITTLEALVKKHDHLWYELSLAYAYLQNKNQIGALSIYKGLSDIYPGYLPVIHEYARALIQFGKYGACTQLLEKQLTETYNSNTYKLLAQSYSGQKQLLNAYITNAKLYAHEGLYELAIQQINSALQLPDIKPEATARLEATIEIYKKNYKIE
ncbi:MAG: M48 family metalloprotease [Gammaproteobacteria bacterium]|nr:M48 family metalloprotease [Gammaproteobacteria bacterium]